MQESVTITQFRNYQIDGIVRVTKDAKVLTLTYDDKGMQQSCVIQPQPRKFGFFVDLPVINAKGKSKLVPVALQELYQFAFPDLPLPADLKIQQTQQSSQFTPLQPNQQQDLFE